METIEVRGLEVWARHGVMEQERVVGNLFRVDVALSADLSSAMASDRVDDTINYARVVEIVKQQMDAPSRLLENVAWRIKTAILNEFPQVKGGQVTVAKIVPPIPCVLESVSVTTRW